MACHSPQQRRRRRLFERPRRFRSTPIRSLVLCRTTAVLHSPMRLLPGSPAINAGDPNYVGPPDYDQRGPDFVRVRGGRIDVGSVEVQNPPTPTATPRLTPDSTISSDTSAATVASL